MTRIDFAKYPKVPSAHHYPLPTGLLTVQEKLDGANAGISIDPENPHCVIINSRTRALARMWVGGGEQLVDDLGSFGSLLEYVAPRLPSILQFMRSQGVQHIYGEWLIKHTLSYPDAMYRHFYVFDLLRGGCFHDPAEWAQELLACDLQVVRTERLKLEDGVAGLPVVEELCSTIGASRPIEGVVVKSYVKDAVGALDEYGQRYCYKYVLPDFKEQHAGNPMFPPRAHALTLEQRLAGVVSDRTLEKLYQKVCDAKGGWQNKHIPMLLGLTWQEFLEEHAVAAFKEEHLPTVDIRALKTELETRARNFALTRPLDRVVGE